MFFGPPPPGRGPPPPARGPHPGRGPPPPVRAQVVHAHTHAYYDDEYDDDRRYHDRRYRDDRYSRDRRYHDDRYSRDDRYRDDRYSDDNRYDDDSDRYAHKKEPAPKPKPKPKPSKKATAPAPVVVPVVEESEKVSPKPMTVQLSLYATNLPNVAGMFNGTSDPYAVVKKLSKGRSPVGVGKTEVINKSVNPSWTKRFVVDHDFAKNLHLSIAVYDKRSKGEDKPMGSAMFNIGSIDESKGSAFEKRMKGGGTINVRIQKYEKGGNLKLQLKAIKLKSTEGLGFGVLTKSDPFFELHKKSRDKKRWELVYRSKPVMNNLSPVWAEAVIDISTLCGKELDLPIKVKVLDWEKDGRHDDMGEFETSVNGILAAKSFSSTMDINKADLDSAFTLTKGGSKKETGQIVVLRADLVGFKEAKPAVKEIPKKSDPVPQANEPTPSKSNESPANTPQNKPPSNLPSNEPPPYVPPNEPSTYVPSYEPPPYVPSNEAPPYAPSNTYVPPSSNEPPTYDPSLVVASPSFGAYIPPPNFEAYLSGGCKMNIAVAIDFSSSNGDPRQIGNLHYLSSYEGDKNEYEKALTAIGSGLEEHEPQKKFPMWGFGGKYGGKIRHCFQCGSAVEVDGIENVLSTYRQVFKSGMAMSEPTVITDVVTTAAHHAKEKLAEAQQRGSQAYMVLFILTDGQLADFNEAARTIYDVTDTPMSIVAIGLGNGDFSGMRYLDGLERDGRNIFKFVSMNDLKSNMGSIEKVTMDRVPKQLVEYFTKHDIKPNSGGQQECGDIVL